MASVHESLYFNPMMTNGVVHANVFGIKDWVTPYKIAVLVLLNEMGRTGEGAVSLMERRRLNQLLLPLLQVSGSHRLPLIQQTFTEHLLCAGHRTGPGGGGARVFIRYSLSAGGPKKKKKKKGVNTTY